MMSPSLRRYLIARSPFEEPETNSDRFEFSAKFQDVYFAILPAGIMILLSCYNLFRLQRKPRKVLGARLRYAKLLFLICYTIITIILIPLQRLQTFPVSETTTPSQILLAVAASFLCWLSYLHHSKRTRASTLILLYLLTTTTCLTTRIVSLWGKSQYSTILGLLLAELLLVALSFGLECMGKHRYLTVSCQHYTPEQSSNVFEVASFSWMYSVLWIGARKTLAVDDMLQLDTETRSHQKVDAFIQLYQRIKPHFGNNSLFLTVLLFIRKPIAVSMLPRICMVGLVVCQPLILHALLDYLTEASRPASSNHGAWITAGYSLLYVGLAFATGAHHYYHYKSVAMSRGCLVSMLGWKVTRLDSQYLGDDKMIISHLSHDVELIDVGLRDIHEFWAVPIQTALATYILYTRIGIASLLPIFCSCLAALAANSIAKGCNIREKLWMSAVEERIGMTSAAISNMQEVKMKGVSREVEAEIVQLRKIEMQLAGRHRVLIVSADALACIPEYISPILAFLVFILVAKQRGIDFDASTLFSTFAIILVVAQPLNQLFRYIPSLMTALASLQRLDDFLNLKEQNDYRTFLQLERQKLVGREDQEKVSDIQVEMLSKEEQPAMYKDLTRALAISLNGSISWNTGTFALKNINVAIPICKTTVITGPVGSGKTTLCASFLGETTIDGNVEVMSFSNLVAYCHQVPYLFKSSVRNNIIGQFRFEEPWFRKVIEACDLTTDLEAFPERENTSVGVGGSNLSGGQRHKVALARALYSRLPILVLDDIFSGLDAHSEEQIFQNVFGANGLVVKHSLTAILVTHNARWLNHADSIISLDMKGLVNQETGGKYSQTLDAEASSATVTGKEINPSLQRESNSSDDGQTAQHTASDEQEDCKDAGGGKENYLQLLRAGGVGATLVIVGVALANGVCVVMPSVWLKLWTEISAHRDSLSTMTCWAIYAAIQILPLITQVGLFYCGCVRINQKVGINVHNHMLRKVMTARAWIFRHSNSSSIISPFSQDLLLVDTELNIGVICYLLSIFIVAGQCIAIAVSSPWTAVALPFLFAIFFAVQRFYLETSRQLRVLELKANEPLHDHVIETVAGLLTIRSFGWTKSNLETFLSLFEASQRVRYILSMARGWLWFALNMIVAVAAIIVVSLAIGLNSNSAVTGVALIQVMSLSFMLGVVVTTWTEMETSIGALSRIRKLTKSMPSEESLADLPSPPQNWPSKGRLEISNLTAKYDSASPRTALDQINLTIEPGDKIGICGRSGSGKSTFLLCLLRLLDNVEGSIVIDDVEIQNIPHELVRQRLNTIPQRFLFLPGSIRSVIDPARQHNDQAIVDALKKVKLWPDVISGDLDTKLNVHTLSHGQRQLLNIASALLKKSKIVILDEVTGSLDLETDDIVQQVIRDEWNGCTMLVIAHRLRTIIDFDRVVVLDGGTVAEVGNPRELLKKQSAFKHLWDQQGHPS